jgi:hypothetical protein
MDSEMHREIARHRQADLARLAQQELLLTAGVTHRGVRPREGSAGLRGLFALLPGLRVPVPPEPVPDAPVNIDVSA